MTLEEILQHVFYRKVYEEENLVPLSENWLDSDSFTSEMQRIFVDAIFELGYTCDTEKYVELLWGWRTHFRNFGLQISQNEYFGNHEKFVLSIALTKFESFFIHSKVADAIENFGPGAFERAVSRIAVEEGWRPVRAQAFDFREFDADIGSPSIPASNRIVRIDHNKATEFTKSADQIASQIAQRNEVSGSVELRDYLVGCIRAGSELLNAGCFKPYTLEVTLLQSLRFLASRYEKETIGGLAAALATSLVQHFGLPG